MKYPFTRTLGGAYGLQRHRSHLSEVAGVTRFPWGNTWRQPSRDRRPMFPSWKTFRTS
ncbi:hypothetical protein ACFFX0_18510 [Citricoccus parietis]|uniref:Uncharacterized protein n=1 Tax=Citricoccus parietis TaxID=592307 RepID=A0ABV5G2C7_9MICC